MDNFPLGLKFNSRRKSFSSSVQWLKIVKVNLNKNQIYRKLPSCHHHWMFMIIFTLLMMEKLLFLF